MIPRKELEKKIAKDTDYIELYRKVKKFFDSYQDIDTLFHSYISYVKEKAKITLADSATLNTQQEANIALSKLIGMLPNYIMQISTCDNQWDKYYFCKTIVPIGTVADGLKQQHRLPLAFLQFLLEMTYATKIEYFTSVVAATKYCLDDPDATSHKHRHHVFHIITLFASYFEIDKSRNYLKQMLKNDKNFVQLSCGWININAFVSMTKGVRMLGHPDLGDWETTYPSQLATTVNAPQLLKLFIKYGAQPNKTVSTTGAMLEYADDDCSSTNITLLFRRLDSFDYLLKTGHATVDTQSILILLWVLMSGKDGRVNDQKAVYKCFQDLLSQNDHIKQIVYRNIFLLDLRARFPQCVVEPGTWEFDATVQLFADFVAVFQKLGSKQLVEDIPVLEEIGYAKVLKKVLEIKAVVQPTTILSIPSDASNPPNRPIKRKGTDSAKTDANRQKQDPATQCYNLLLDATVRNGGLGFDKMLRQLFTAGFKLDDIVEATVSLGRGSRHGVTHFLLNPTAERRITSSISLLPESGSSFHSSSIAASMSESTSSTSSTASETTPATFLAGFKHG